MKKYSNVRSLQISIGEREYDRGDGMPNWLKQFADNYESKTAVEVARERTEDFSDQINAIMGNKSKFSTVDDAVNDYQERTGLKAYLQTISKKASNVAFDAGYMQALKDIENKASLDPQKTYEAWVKSNSSVIKEDDYESWKNGYNKAYAFYKLLKDQLGEKNTDKEIIQRVKLILEDDKMRSSASVEKQAYTPRGKPEKFTKDDLLPETTEGLDDYFQAIHENLALLRRWVQAAKIDAKESTSSDLTVLSGHLSKVESLLDRNEIEKSPKSLQDAYTIMNALSIYFSTYNHDISKGYLSEIHKTIQNIIHDIDQSNEVLLGKHIGYENVDVDPDKLSEENVLPGFNEEKEITEDEKKDEESWAIQRDLDPYANIEEGPGEDLEVEYPMSHDNWPADKRHEKKDLDIYKKRAQLEISETTITEPKLLQKFPEIKYFIDNLVKTQHGNVHTPAILQDISAIYKNQGVKEEDVNDPEVLKYINDIIAGEQELHTEQVEHRVGEGVGVQDTGDNEDAFSFQSKMRAG